MNINNPTTFGSPALVYSTSNSSGTGGALRADDTIAVFSSTVPTTIGYSASAATGDNAFASREDHVHGMAAASTLVSNLVAGTRTAAAGAGDQTITGFGFDPTTVFMTFNVSVATYTGSIGIGDDDGDAAAWTIYGTAQNIDTWDYLANIDLAGGHVMSAVIKEYTDDGLILTWSKSGNGADMKFSIMGISV